ncbi:MAG: type II secretion system protein GspG [Deltaproteobacteria bacterium]|nr:MAG: type II secretion system protein GspG [Deltaproteobacteria bacterium]
MHQNIAVQTRRSDAGFTLIELMVVIVILGVLAGWVVPKFMGQTAEAKRTRAAADIRSIETALKMFKLNHGTFPTTEQGLAALITAPESLSNAKKWQEGGYLDVSRVPSDPWGNAYLYLCPGLHGAYDITSYGLDGVPGGEGEDADINSWEID